LLAETVRVMHYRDLYFLLFCFLSIALTSCASRNEKDPLALADSLANERSHWFGVEINVIYSSPTQLTVNGKLYNSNGAIFSDSTKLFANEAEMHYSVGIGNYYDKYPGYSIKFEDKKIPKDTLSFSVQLKDFSKHTIGYVCIRQLVPMINDGNLSKEIEHDKSKPLVINWGNSADSLVLYRNYYGLVDSVKTFSGGPNDPSSLLQPWYPNKSITVPVNYFKADSTIVYGLYLSWIKSVKGKITNPSIYGAIKAKCEVNQAVTLEKIEF